jgi:hypothetical protein
VVVPYTCVPVEIVKDVERRGLPPDAKVITRFPEPLSGTKLVSPGYWAVTTSGLVGTVLAFVQAYVHVYSVLVVRVQPESGMVAVK